MRLRSPLIDTGIEMGENIASTPAIPMLLIGSFTNKGEREREERGIGSNTEIFPLTSAGLSEP